MVIIESYPLAVVLCFVTMLCWGSWANTQKLASKEWRFQLFYWDYAIGVLLLSLIMAFTLGSFGAKGRVFFTDLAQAGGQAVCMALLGGIVFNLANILLVGAIDIAGLAVAFPIGIGIAGSLGVTANYIGNPVGDPILLFSGVASVIIAVLLDAFAYRKLPSQGQKTTAKGIIISIISGVFMGLFYRFVAASMSSDFSNLEAGKLGPYSAVVLFSIGLLLSNFVWNSIVMAKPFTGEPVPYGDYIKKGNLKLHVIGILGGVIWCVGMSFSIIAAGSAGFAISYGLGQGATMVAVIWGVFIWKEFKEAPKDANKLLVLMFLFYVLGFALIIIARFVELKSLIMK